MNSAENSESIEKKKTERPKKERLPISQKQREHLADMRDKKKAIRILKKDENYSKIISQPVPQREQTHKENIDIIKMSNELAQIKQHLEEMKRLKEEKKKLKESIDIKTTYEKKESYDDLYYKTQLMRNFIK